MNAPSVQLSFSCSTKTLLPTILFLLDWVPFLLGSEFVNRVNFSDLLQKVGLLR